jgi:hypothetical protein
MKTNVFFELLQKEGYNVSLMKTFSYRINKDKSFYTINTFDTPTVEFWRLCNDNHFDIFVEVLADPDEETTRIMYSAISREKEFIDVE